VDIVVVSPAAGSTPIALPRRLFCAPTPARCMLVRPPDTKWWQSLILYCVVIPRANPA